MNRIHIGIRNKVELPKTGGYLLIDDTVRKIRGAKVFDPRKHSFNPLRKLDYRRICDFIDIIDALFSRGESTLTKDTGLDFIAERLKEHPNSLQDLIPKPDKKASTDHIWAWRKIQHILHSPTLSRVLCSSTAFSFDPDAMTVARVNRAELTAFDARVIALLLMANFPGQIVLPNLGFYGRDLHAQLIEEERLICGITYLNQLKRAAPGLRDAVMLIGDRVPQGARYRDAVELAEAAGYRNDPLREDNDFHKYIDSAMA